MICSIVIPWKSADFPLFMDFIALVTVNAAIMFHVFLLQDSFAITKILKVQIFRGMTLVYIAADIGWGFFYNKSCLSHYIIDRSIDIPH